MVFYLTGNHDEDFFLTVDDMPKENWDALMSCYHSGACDDDVDYASKYFEITDFQSAFNYIVECGLEKEEFMNNSKLDEERIIAYYLWILSADIQENAE
jgi:hypothetical protein